MHLRPVSLVLALCLAAHLHAAPANTGLESIQQQETLETLHLGEPATDDTSVRDKRTIGPLRQLFPGLSQIVDRKIQQITRTLFRVIGRLVLNGGQGGSSTGGAGASSSSSSGGGRKVSITLPTYPPGEDDEDEDEDEDSTPAPSTDSPASADSSASASASASASSGSESSTPADTENQLSGAESQISEVRVQLNDKPAEPAEAVEEVEQDEGDLKPAASEDNLADADQDQARDLENEAEAVGDDENRNKRFLPFNLNGGGSGGGSGGSGGGSGNFLFDIIRWLQRMADAAARVTGKVYRVVAGTDNAGLGFRIPTSYNQQDNDNTDSDKDQSNNNHNNNNNSNDDNKGSASNINTSLIAGSGTTQERDEAENAPADGSTSSAGASASSSASASAGGSVEGKADDGYQEGVPGPITRLFVIANRGIANLVQDLILRLAQTSERLVNFKARLITSII